MSGALYFSVRLFVYDCKVARFAEKEFAEEGSGEEQLCGGRIC